MKERLLHRVLERSCLVDDPSSRHYLDGICLAMKQQSKSGQLTWVVADNVARFYFESPQAEFDLEKDIPSFAPPWPSFFIEWNEHSIFRVGDQVRSIEQDLQLQIGCLVESCESSAMTLSQHKFAAIAMSGIDPLSSKQDSTCDTLSQWLDAKIPQSKWLMFMHPYMAMSAKPSLGNPMTFLASITIAIDEHGKYLGHVYSGPSLVNVDEDKKEYMMRFFENIMNVVGLTLSFCACKNVSIKSVSHERRPLRPSHPPRRSSYKMLEIGQIKEVLRTEGKSDVDGLARALHICRGHFAEYSSERPLFGKYSGKFWIPMHIRGKANVGEVSKGYAVG